MFIARSKLRRRARIASPHGVDEGRYERIGEVDQWLRIRGEDRANPVLLVVHGGPGSPYSIFNPVLREWERHFTVVHWDRRGAGRTLRRNGSPTGAELTFERMVADGAEVAEFLRQHLGKEKIVLMAGSMGTLVGIPLARRRPDLFSAYVGTDLYANMLVNETRGHRDTLDRLRAAGRRSGVKALERIGGDPATWTVQDWGVRMGWSMGNAPLLRLFGHLLRDPDYSLTDVRAWLKGFSESRDRMFGQFMRWDAETRFEVPFHLIQGGSDVVTLTGPAVEYYDRVEAPRKTLTLIEGAGHFCAFTHPKQFLDALLAADLR